MRATRFVCASVLAGALALVPSSASAQESPQALRQEIDQLRKDFDALKQQYGDRLAALDAKLAAAEGTSPPAAAVPPPSAAPPPTLGSAVANSKVFNPDMAVIGDFLGAGGRNLVKPSPALEMHESELSLQAVVDPYARADFFVAFGEEGVELEEGFITLTELPGGLLTKVGKMRAAFGKVNTLHNHSLTWTDRPLATQNLLGGEEGIGDAGISVARLIPNPWIFLEATGQVFRGDSSDVFKSNQRSDLSYVGHLRGYQDISESSNLDLGFSYSRGHNDSGGVSIAEDASSSFTTQLYGLDATVRWKPLRRSIYQSFVGRSEWIWSRRDQPDGLQRASGFFVSGDYQVDRRWFTGVRFDRSDRATDSSLTDTGGSFIVTYWPSEFSQVRAQYRRTNYALASSANEILFQFQFSIGAHGAHPF